MSAKFNSDPRSVAETAKHAIPQLLAISRDFIELDRLLKQRLDQIPPDAFRVACLRQAELSLFCTDSVWLSKLRLLQPEVLRVCRQLHAEKLLPQAVQTIRIRIKPNPAERFL